MGVVMKWRCVRLGCGRQYTRKGVGASRTQCGSCGSATDTNRHWVTQCPAHNQARATFEQDTGVAANGDNYIRLMALDAGALHVDPEILSTALFRFLARIDRHTPFDPSVVPTSNQGTGDPCR